MNNEHYDVKTCFPNIIDKGGDFDRYGADVSYEAIAALYGDPVVSVSDDDYQGSTSVLLKHRDIPEMFGLLEYSWGSCSGCDSLQAAESTDDLQNLVDSMGSSIEWLNRMDMIEKLKKFDDDYGAERINKFLKECENVFGCEFPPVKDLYSS